MVRALNPGPSGDDQPAADLDDELDRLYGAELGGFVAERTRLATSLRKEGRRVEAARVKELRKPSLSAWAINQLVRSQRKDIDLLLDAGEQLVVSQRALLTQGGDQGAFEQARQAERSALNRLVQAAKPLLAERASASVLERLATTLRAAVVSEEARRDLARGRLTGEVDLPGFEAFAGLLPGKSEPLTREARPQRVRATRAAHAEAERRSLRRHAVSRATSELNAVKEREAVVARSVREAERAERAARDQLERAAKAVERLRAERQAAAAAVEAARAKLDEARHS